MLCTTWPPIPHTYKTFQEGYFDNFYFHPLLWLQLRSTHLKDKVDVWAAGNVMYDNAKIGFGHRRGTDIAVNTDNFAVNAAYNSVAVNSKPL